jgi:hypothetical protein
VDSATLSVDLGSLTRGTFLSVGGAGPECSIGFAGAFGLLRHREIVDGQRW